MYQDHLPSLFRTFFMKPSFLHEPTQFTKFPINLLFSGSVCTNLTCHTENVNDFVI